MSIRDYLTQLDYDQLQNAKKIADELIAKKEAEEKIKLLVVSNDIMNLAAFYEIDYQKAVERMLSEIKTRAEKPLGYGFKYELKAYFFRESEVQGMLDL